MMLLREQLKNIAAPSESIRTAACHRWSRLRQPLEERYLLENTTAKVAALAGTLDIALVRRVLLVLCADNGIAGNSTHCNETTVEMVESLAEGRNAVYRMARMAQCHVLPVDMGIAVPSAVEGILDRRIMDGTSDITAGPAMVEQDCILAVETGMNLVRDLRNDDTSIILTGSLGVGSDITSCAIASVLLSEPPERILGQETALPQGKYEKKIAMIRKAIAANQLDCENPLNVMSKIGGLDIAGLCGVFLGCALYQVPVLIDGFVSASAALCAARLCSRAKSAMLASCMPAEPGGRLILETLGLHPLISAGMELDGGSNAVMALPLLDMAFAVFNGL